MQLNRDDLQRLQQKTHKGSQQHKFGKYMNKKYKNRQWYAHISAANQFNTGYKPYLNVLKVHI